jgi:hypothetical protein
MDILTAALAIGLLKPMRRRLLAGAGNTQPHNPALKPAFE